MFCGMLTVLIVLGIALAVYSFAGPAIGALVFFGLMFYLSASVDVVTGELPIYIPFCS